MNVREAAAKFKTDGDCLTYLEQMRWLLREQPTESRRHRKFR